MDHRQVGLTALQGLKQDSFAAQVESIEKCRKALGFSPPQGDASSSAEASIAQLQELTRWLKKGGAQMDSVKVCRVEELMCNGVQVAQDIPEAKEVFAVPRSLMLTAEDIASSSTPLAQLTQTNPVLQSKPMVILALGILAERAKGSESAYAPYIAALPRTFPGLPLYWSNTALLLLEGTEAGDAALSSILNSILAFCHLAAQFKPCNLGDVSFNDFLWASAITMTRQNSVPSKLIDGASTLAMIPLFDMCNHEEGKFCSAYDMERSELTCTARRDMGQGEAFKIFYGPRTNTDLLVYSGFVMEPGTNKSHQAKVQLSFASDDSLAKLKQMLASKSPSTCSKWFALAPQKSQEALEFALLAVASKEQLTEIMRGQGGGTSIVAVDTTHEARASEWLDAQRISRKSELEKRLARLEDGLVKTYLQGDLYLLQENN